jgi:hypothetical protein
MDEPMACAADPYAKASSSIGQNHPLHPQGQKAEQI